MIARALSVCLSKQIESKLAVYFVRNPVMSKNRTLTEFFSPTARKRKGDPIIPVENAIPVHTEDEKVSCSRPCAAPQNVCRLSDRMNPKLAMQAR